MSWPKLGSAKGSSDPCNPILLLTPMGYPSDVLLMATMKAEKVSEVTGVLVSPSLSSGSLSVLPTSHWPTQVTWSNTKPGGTEVHDEATARVWIQGGLKTQDHQWITHTIQGQVNDKMHLETQMAKWQSYPQSVCRFKFLSKAVLLKTVKVSKARKAWNCHSQDK